jgi:hypothetical protein
MMVSDKAMVNDVVLVKDLKFNLFSISQMIDGDFEVCFKKNQEACYLPLACFWV